MRNRLKEFRKQRGISQEELATKVEVTRQTIIAVEAGNYNPSTLLSLKLALHLRVKIEDLFQLDKSDN
ncbi:MAG: helix-turn-helix transcriptional regulator [Flavobacteriales bacterium]